VKNFIKKLLGIDELEEKFKSTHEHAIKLEKQLLDKDKEITDLIDALSEVKDTKKQIEKEKMKRQEIMNHG
jgi:septal ring factor EnvC (AmiA/AmiB activator)